MHKVLSVFDIYEDNEPIFAFLSLVDEKRHKFLKFVLEDKDPIYPA